MTLARALAQAAGRTRDVTAAVARHPIGGAALLLGLVLVVFRDGFWGVPRSDQLVYLYEAARFPRFVDLFAHALVLDRTAPVGDRVLFRPLLHALVTCEYGLFGYNFFLWQAVGIGLHAAQSIAMLRLLQRASPATTSLNLAGSGLFVTLLISSEAVIWHHISGYLLFTLCMTTSALYVLRYLDGGGRRAAGTAVLLAAVSAFTYELGAMYCLLVAAVMAVRARWPGPATDSRPRAGAGVALAFAGIAVAYLAMSAGDFYARFATFPQLGAGGPEVGRGLAYTAYQVGFWLGGAIAPTTYGITWGGGRSFFEGYRLAGSPLTLLNLAAALAAAVGAAGYLVLGRRPLWRTARIGAAIGGGLLVAYSGLIALGRSVPRGLEYTLAINLYYAYIAMVIALGTVALAMWTSRAVNRGTAAKWGAPATRAHRLCHALFLAGIVGLAAVNAWATMALLADYRRIYAARVMELMHHARLWHEARAPGEYFTVREGCPGNQQLVWFSLYLRHDTDRVYFLDALYPETSANLNRTAAAQPGARVRALSCTEGVLDPRLLLGRWRAQGGAPIGRVTSDGRVELVDERGSASDVTAEGRLLFARQWKLAGMISHDHRYLFWEDSRTWWR